MSGTKRWHRVYVRDDDEQPKRVVYCHTTRGFKDIERCAECPRFFALDHKKEDSFLICRAPSSKDRSSTDTDPITSDTIPPGANAEINLSTPVEDVMAGDIFTVPARTRVRTLERWFLEHRLRVALVMDGHPVGIVVRADVMAADGDERATDVMVPTHATVPRKAPLAKAAATMSHYELPYIAVVDDEGAAVGVLGAYDVLRWLARHGGYAA
jgi:CBS domain-containing protein